MHATSSKKAASRTRATARSSAGSRSTKAQGGEKGSRLRQKIGELRKRVRELEGERASLRGGRGETEGLREKLESAEKKIRALRSDLKEARKGLRAAEAEKRKLERKLGRVEKKNAELREALEEARRAGKRQAAPFSKGDPKPKPKKPGRKRGPDYGKRASRPKPEYVDEVNEATLPETCPHCESDEIEETGIEEQFVTDLPPDIKPHVTQNNVHIGVCKKCGKRIQGRHPKQHSDALGAAANQIGPGVIALGAHLNKVTGASYGKIAQLLLAVWCLNVHRSTLCRALKRTAEKAEPLYDHLLEEMRRSNVVYCDETGWKIGGRRAWLWIFTTMVFTVYMVRESRGKDVIDEAVGLDFDGTLGHDGWHSYDQCKNATHQQCLAHPIFRARKMLATAKGPAAEFPWNVKRILQKALRLRDRRRDDEISEHGFRSARGRLEKELDHELARRLSHEPNVTFANHLRKHRDEWFTFLYRDDVEATNWPGEQGLRPAVINRKVSGGGNRTHTGARTQEILMSIQRTCTQRGISAIELLKEMLRSTDPEECARQFIEEMLAAEENQAQGP